MFQYLKDAIEVGNLKPKLPEWYLLAVLVVCGMYLCWHAGEGLKQKISEDHARKVELNAQRVRADKPWQIAAEMYPKYHHQPMCLQYAINLAYKINTETDAQAEVLAIKFFDYVDYQFHAHAMCVWFYHNHTYVADQNYMATEVPYEKIHWPEGDAGFANTALHTHWTEFDDAAACAVTEVQWLNGKADVMRFFGPNATGYYKMLDHLNYFPLDYCFD